MRGAELDVMAAVLVEALMTNGSGIRVERLILKDHARHEIGEWGPITLRDRIRWHLRVLDDDVVRMIRRARERAEWL